MTAYELADWLDRRRDAYEPNGWSADMLRQQADRIAHLEILVANRNEIIDKLDLTTPQIKERCEPLCKPSVCNCIKKELSDEEIKKCVIAWVKQIYGNEYVTPSDRHIINGTKLIRLAEKRIFKNDSL